MDKIAKIKLKKENIEEQTELAAALRLIAIKRYWSETLHQCVLCTLKQTRILLKERYLTNCVRSKQKVFKKHFGVFSVGQK